MAFAVTAYKVQAIPVGTARARKWRNVVEIDITAANTDTDGDLGDLAAGAFWTAAEADGTHGDTATALKAILTALYAKSSNILWSCSEIDAGLIQVASGASGSEYQVTKNATTGLPDFVFVSGSGLTAWTLTIDASILEASSPTAPSSVGTI